MFVPSKLFLTKGAGVHKEKLTSFEMALSDTDEPHRLVAASIGVALAKDPAQHGYLSEHHSHGETEEKAGEYAEDLAAVLIA